MVRSDGSGWCLWRGRASAVRPAWMVWMAMDGDGGYKLRRQHQALDAPGLCGGARLTLEHHKMAANKNIRIGPVALTTTLTTNILNP